MKQAIILMLLLAALMWACADDDKPVGSLSADRQLVPLTIGNTWWATSYVYYVPEDSVELVPATIRVVDDTVVNGQTWYDFSTHSEGPRRMRNWSQNRPDGFYRLVRGSEGLEEHYEFKYPADAGEYFLRGQDTVRVLATDSIVTVGGHQFWCHVYYSRSVRDGVRFYYFLVPGLGYIKSIGAFGDDDSLRTYFELDSALIL